MLSRRGFLNIAAGATASLAAPAILTRTARAEGPFIQPSLLYETADLAPVIGQRTVELHYGVHHAGYYRNLNRLVADSQVLSSMSLEDVIVAARDPYMDRAVFNNAGQAWNHDVYWEQMAPGGASEPSGRLLTMIEESFGTLEGFKDEFVSTAGSVFGSGWAWLVQNDTGLALMGTSNADNPVGSGVTTLLGIDVWEHAYYLDYENRRGEHVRAVLDSAINWDVVADRLA